MAQVTSPAATLPLTTAMSGSVPATLPFSGWHWVKRVSDWCQYPNNAAVSLINPVINPANHLPYAAATPGFKWVKNPTGTSWSQVSTATSSQATALRTPPVVIHSTAAALQAAAAKSTGIVNASKPLPPVTVKSSSTPSADQSLMNFLEWIPVVGVVSAIGYYAFSKKRKRIRFRILGKRIKI